MKCHLLQEVLLDSQPVPEDPGHSESCQGPLPGLMICVLITWSKLTYVQHVLLGQNSP